MAGQSDENKFESAASYNHKSETDRIEMRKQIIDMIDYPDVDFANISWVSFQKRQASNRKVKR